MSGHYAIINTRAKENRRKKMTKQETMKLFKNSFKKEDRTRDNWRLMLINFVKTGEITGKQKTHWLSYGTQPTYDHNTRMFN